MRKTKPQTSTKPTHRLYSVSGEGDDTNWTQIGAAWAHKDGKGFNLVCDAVPVNGRIVMRLATAKTDGAQ